MKRIALYLLCCICIVLNVNAQKIALIDMEYILENIPAYQKANNELNAASQQYQKVIDTKMKEAEDLYTAYQKNSNSMNASLRTQKEEAIVAKEKEAMELRKKYFGPEGEMSKLEERMITPIQNQIYETVKRISQQKGYEIVFDRASATSMIYASPHIDISNEVLNKLGYSK